MFCVALIGNFDDSGIARCFRSRLDGVLVVESETAVVFEGCGVTVIKKFSEADLSHCRGSVIISSENTAQLKRMLALDNRVITCGMGEKDTVTCASRTKDTAVIALQRSLAGLDAPLELPVAADEGEDIYTVLALETVRALAQKHISRQE